MRKWPVAILLIFYANAFLAPAAVAYDLTIGSLNTLHLGWGSATNTSNKCTQINELLKTADILLLQETMKTTLPCTIDTTNFDYTCSALKGASSYKESYCFIFRKVKSSTKAGITVLGTVDAPNGSFSRPPYAIFAQVTLPNSTKKYMWFANIHSVFGKTTKPRQDEASAAGTFFNSLAKTPVKISPTQTITPGKTGFPIAIGGDWNLPIQEKNDNFDPGFTWVDPTKSQNTGPIACPSRDPTSLTTAGAPSSPYDHIIVSSATLTHTVSCYITVNALTQQNWRKTVSDHQAIYWEIGFK